MAHNDGLTDTEDWPLTARDIAWLVVAGAAMLSLAGLTVYGAYTLIARLIAH
jgi:hypothetical protein